MPPSSLVRERERERERERKKGGGREKEREREEREYLSLKGMTGALTPFSYLVVK